MADLTLDAPIERLSHAVSARPWARRWLKIIVFMIFCMVVIGGATRLTNSGLSITEWQPFLGAIPPLTAADWQAAFEKYQASSQYKLQTHGMDFSSFQFIYWWEWSHRQLGRLIGVAFLPLIVMALARRLEWRMWPRVLGLMALLGLQGALGWYMVSSGLENRVDVSQYRLAAHLLLATIFFAAVLWTIMTLQYRHARPRDLDSWVAVLLLLLVFVQIAAGGFVAGLDAGQAYNTWPTMEGQWIPAGLYDAQPFWRNIFENAMTVQFDHRMLAYFIFVVALWHALRSFTFPSMLVAYLVLTQACLGILTLLMHVPLGIALIHQAGALAVLAATVWNVHVKTRQAIA
jgi:heme a synthase